MWEILNNGHPLESYGTPAVSVLTHDSRLDPIGGKSYIDLMSLRWVNFKIIISCLSGNILEWFDFAVYGYLAPIIATQFFPSTHKLTSILLTYSVFAIGFFARPFGAAIFGHIGDTRGRKAALILSTLTMAVPTFLIGI